MPNPKLSDTQLVILNAAATREDRALCPVPDSVKAKGKVLARSLAGLIDRGLAEEVESVPAEQAWRTDEDDRPIGLAITDAGLAAIGIGAAENGSDGSATDTEGEPGAPTSDQRPPKPESKTAKLIERLSAADGATLDDLTAAFGWLPHSARAALTGLRKRGYTVEREKRDDGTSVYRLVTTAEEAAA